MIVGLMQLSTVAIPSPAISHVHTRTHARARVHTHTHTALIYSPLESVIAHSRGVEDSLNSVAAATVTGALYKSTGKSNVMCALVVTSCVPYSWSKAYGNCQCYRVYFVWVVHTGTLHYGLLRQTHHLQYIVLRNLL